MSQQPSGIHGFDSQQLKSWINSLNELTTPQKESICDAINKSGCTGNTLSQATGAQDIKEELQITTLLSRQLYALTFPNHPTEEKQVPQATHINMANLELNYTAQVKQQTFDTHAMKMWISWKISATQTKPTVTIPDRAKPTYFNHVHPATWDRIVHKLYYGWPWYCKPEYYQQISTEIFGYFNKKETWSNPKRSTSNVQWCSLSLFIFGIIAIIIGAILLILSFNGDKFVLFLFSGFAALVVGAWSIMFSCHIYIDNDESCCGLGTIGRTEPASHGERWVWRQPTQKEGERMRAIQDMYGKNTMDALEKLFEDLNREFDGYVKFSKKVAPVTNVDGYGILPRRDIAITIHVVADEVPHPNEIKGILNDNLEQCAARSKGSFERDTKQGSTVKTPLLASNVASYQ